MLCNDIPGLKYSVENSKMGYCCDINNASDIQKKVDLILYNYDELSKNAIKFNAQTNVSREVEELLYEQK